MSVAGRRRALAALALVALALVALAIIGFVIAGRAGGGEPAIANGAARLVPADALVYVHLSTDPHRAAVRRAQSLAARFPSYGRLRDNIIRRLSVNGDAADVAGFLGKEAALAFLSSGSGTAGSLVVFSVRDQAAARRFLAEGRGHQAPPQRYRGVRMDQYGQVMAGFVGQYVVIGQKASVEQAIDLSQGKGRSLAADEQYKRAMAGAPGDRFADGYVTGDGVNRLLVPAGGLLGAAGALLDRPGLRATALSLSADDPGAKLTVHTLGGTGQFGPFTPRLLSAAPRGALAYIGVRGFDQAAARLLAATGAQATTLAQVIGAIPRDVITALRGEVALVLTTRGGRTVLSVVARAGDEARTRAALRGLAAPLRKLLPKLRTTSTKVAGVPVTVLRGGSGFELDAAVFEGKLVLSTAPAGIDAVRSSGPRLADSEVFRRVVAAGGSPVTAVGFLDFDQLLALAERTGLNQSKAYRAIRADLRRVRAVGFRSSGSGGDTTAEIQFDIP